MAPLFHPVAAHFPKLAARDSVDILLEISLAECLASMHGGLDDEEALDTMLDDLLH